MKKFVVMLLCVFLLSSVALAVDIAVMSGLRNGLTLGILVDQETGNAIGARYGIELSNGSKPVIAFLGGKAFLTEVQDIYPLHVGGGVIGYFGDGESRIGVSVGVILDEVFGIDLLSIETGIDALANDSKIQVQAIYEIHNL